MSQTTSTLYHPSTWPTWIGLGVLRLLVVLLPYCALMAVGRLLGTLGYRILRRRRHIARVNIDLCFPDLSEAERSQLVRRSFQSLGMGIVETAFMWWGKTSTLPCTIEGLEHVLEAQRQGHGVLLIGAHFTTIDLGGALLSAHLEFDGMYRPQNNPVINALLLRYRRQYAGEPIPRSDMRTLIRRLKQGRTIWYAPDQDYGRHHSVFAPFFGHPAATVTITARLVERSGALPLMISQARDLAAGCYVIRIEPMAEAFPSGDAVRDAAIVNRGLEAAIRRHPEQYYWLHRRFKTQPDQPKGALYR